MSKPTTEIEPYIDRSLYDTTLQELRAKNDTSLLIGYRSPYTGKVIRTEYEADLYLQQQALSTMYRSAASTALGKIRSESNARINELEGRVRDLEKKKRRRPLLAVLLLCAAFFAGSQINGTAPDRSSPSSHSAVNSSVSATATPRPTARPTIRPTTAPKPTAAPKPASTATPAPKSTTYRTTPISGYSLTRTVYVSNSGGKIHLRSNCSGMKYYTSMTYGEACERGYTHCKKCF